MDLIRDEYRLQRGRTKNGAEGPSSRLASTAAPWSFNGAAPKTVRRGQPPRSKAGGPIGRWSTSGRFFLNDQLSKTGICLLIGHTINHISY